MTFEAWLIKQKNRDDAIGDLATDFISAKKIRPRHGQKCDRAHLDSWHAISRCYDALAMAKNEYRKLKHTKKRK